MNLVQLLLLLMPMMIVMMIAMLMMPMTIVMMVAMLMMPVSFPMQYMLDVPRYFRKINYGQE